MTALHVAAANGKIDLIRLLIADGASLEAKMNDGTTPVMLARKSNQNDAAEILEDAAATPVEVDTAGLRIIQSLGSDVVFFTSKSKPITSVAEIKSPGTQFAVAEFSPRMTRLLIMVQGIGAGSAIMEVCPQDEAPVYEKSNRRLVWRNGAVSFLFSAEEPERLRGPQHMKLWCDEIAAWRNPDACWEQAEFGLRLGASRRR